MKTPEITVEQMVEWLKEEKRFWSHFAYYGKIIDAIIAALEPATEGERREMLEHFNKHVSFIIGGEDTCPTCVKIRTLILGNQGGAVTEKEQVAGLEPWVEEELRQSMDVANKFHDEIIGKPIREAGVAGKEGQ